MRIWSVRLFDARGFTNDQRLLCAVDWVTAHANVIDVANMSFENLWKNRGGTCAAPKGDAVRAAVCAMTAAGVTAVEGGFLRGDPIEVLGPDGVVVAKALAGYDAFEARIIMGHRSARIAELLGYPGRAALVHRDDLAV